ncbi:MAG: hypothetical protein PUP91_09535 [Rhizonema sp. PD37]|nr:hypothetical protein [Rhizonema sp. PD37]
MIGWEWLLGQQVSLVLSSLTHKFVDYSRSHRNRVAELDRHNHVPLPERVISTHVAAN